LVSLYFFLTQVGVSPNSSKEEIKKNYFEKIKQEHPDKNFGNNENKTQEINSAYEILSDPVKKASHDILGNVEKGSNFFFKTFSQACYFLTEVLKMMKI
jgi:curved DNA-binding protein CbpA